MYRQCNTLMCSISYISLPFRVHLLIPCHEGFIRRYTVCIGICDGKIASYSYQLQHWRRHKYYSLSLTAEKCTNCKQDTVFVPFPSSSGSQKPLLSRLGGENRFHPICQTRERLFSSAMLNVLWTGGAYYVPYSCLLISNKFCNGGKRP